LVAGKASLSPERVPVNVINHAYKGTVPAVQAQTTCPKHGMNASDNTAVRQRTTNTPTQCRYQPTGRSKGVGNKKKTAGKVQNR
jgi:hypothetical protein